MPEIKLMKYKELADLLNVKVDSVKALRRRHNWRVVPANKGREFLVEVPLSYLEEIENRIADKTADITSDAITDVSSAVTGAVTHDVLDRFAAVSRELGELQGRLMVAEQRTADYDELRTKAVALETETKVLAVSLDAERDRREKAEKVLQEYKGRGLLQRIFG